MIVIGRTEPKDPPAVDPRQFGRALASMARFSFALRFGSMIKANRQDSLIFIEGLHTILGARGVASEPVRIVLTADQADTLWKTLSDTLADRPAQTDSTDQEDQA